MLSVLIGSICTESYRKSVFAMRNLNDITALLAKRLWIIPTLVALSAFAIVALIYDPVNASDPTPTPTPEPAPVNPRGPIPAVLSDSDGNNYEVLTPEEGGSFVGDGYSFVAVPGDVPSAYIVGVRVSEGSEASNAGMTHHRYTLGGNYYSVDAVDENGLVPSSGFKFRNPPVACVPMPAHFLANIDSLALIATDLEGATQTVLTSNTRVDGAGLKVCAYVGTVPVILAVGLEGAPAALPTPVMEEPIAKLPVTGGSVLAPNLAVLLLIFGLAIVGVFVRYARMLRRERQ